MVDAVHLRIGTPFSRAKGWTREEIWRVIIRLAEFMSQFKGPLLTMHTCEVHMDTRRDMVSRGWAIPSEVEICNRYVSEFLVAKFAERELERRPLAGAFPTDGGCLKFVFDRNEPFFNALKALREAHMEIVRRAGTVSHWQFVGEIKEGNWREMPGLQAADMLAWGTNRANIAREGKAGKHLAHILRQVVWNTSCVADRSFFRRNYSRQR